MTNVNGLLFFKGGDGGTTAAELWAFDTRQDPIPTVSQWGLIVLGLLLLASGSILVLGRRAENR